MIYGYYCIHPDLVDEHYKIVSLRQRLERLTALGAPEIILVNERRMYDEQKALQSDLSWFRNRIKKLYSDGVVNDILDNYRAVFQDIGFDPSIAYSDKAFKYDHEIGDYFKPLENLPDEAVLAFISYVQHKFDEYLEKYTPRFNEIRSLFISRIRLFVERERYPVSALQNLSRLEQATIEIDDGFETTLEGNAGWHNADRNQIMLSAIGFSGKDDFTLFHECFHALAGTPDDYGGGFHRLIQFFEAEYEDAFKLINETYVNAQAITVFTDKPSEWLKGEQFRDAKLESIIRRTGKHEIPRDVFERAYFSDSIDDVKALADAIKAAFDPDELFTDLQSIKDIVSIDELKFEQRNKKIDRKFLYEHRFDNIDAYFRYCFRNNTRITDEMIKRALKMYADEQRGGESSN